MRATMSELEPAGNGTIRWIGRSGQLADCAAAACIAASVISSAKNARRRIAVPLSSRYRVGFAQALEQRRAQQIFPRQRRVVRGSAQVVVVTLPYRRILLGQKS